MVRHMEYGAPKTKSQFQRGMVGRGWGGMGKKAISKCARHVMFVAPPNAQAETPAQGATPKPKPTRGGDMGVCTQPPPP
ncbi:hypothetical protein Hanom_Chr17g01562741 [Helianthus anomalus]